MIAVFLLLLQNSYEHMLKDDPQPVCNSKKIAARCETGELLSFHQNVPNMQIEIDKKWGSMNEKQSCKTYVAFKLLQGEAFNSHTQITPFRI